MMSDNEFDFDDRLLLMRAVIHQDRRSIASLYLKYSPRLRFYITAYVSSDEDAEDLAQDVFLQLC